MPLRDVKPLHEKQWVKIQDMMKTGPTDKSIAIGKRALKSAKKIKRTAA